MTNASTVEIVYQPKIPAEVTPCECCKHPPELALTVNQRLERAPRGKGQRMAVDAVFCMACGSFPINNAFEHWERAAGALWKEFGWHADIGARLTQFAEIRIPKREHQFFALIHGMSPEETDAYMAEPMQVSA